MRGLLFISRVALICNLCYLVTVGARYIKLSGVPRYVEGTIAVLGIVAIFLNFFVNIAWISSVALKKKGIPMYLAIVNLLFLIFQLLNISIFQL